MLTFENTKPEKCGIPSEAIAAFENALEKLRVRIHGYMMLSGKNILAERYYAPYNKDSLHRMYSVSKSFTALAVGLLIKNGFVTLDDKICDHFPEKLPEEGAHPWCEEMTIRDMLTMRTCHGSTTFKRYGGNDWTESFFRVEPDHIPGTVFSYDTSSSHVLAALVEKLTGMKMLDFMRQEMLDELGFSKEAYMIPDPVGVSQGGSGMMSTLRDMACVAYLCNQYGVLDGKELLPMDFMKEATSNQVPTDLNAKLDEQFGYGYFIWMPREEGFTFFGMGGQLAVCFPKYDFCYVTMADVISNPSGVQLLHDCFYQTVYPYLEKNRERERLQKIPNDVNTIGSTGNLQNVTTDSYKTESTRQMTHNSTYIFYPNKMNWEKVTFDWQCGELRLTLPTEEYVLRFNPKTVNDENCNHEAAWVLQDFLNTGYRCECRGYFKQGHFFLQCFPVDEEQGNMQMDFAWKDSRMTVHVVSTADPFINDISLRKYFQGFASAEAE